jgi:hypothetical protein
MITWCMICGDHVPFNAPYLQASRASDIINITCEPAGAVHSENSHMVHIHPLHARKLNGPAADCMALRCMAMDLSQ